MNAAHVKQNPKQNQRRRGSAGVTAQPATISPSGFRARNLNTKSSARAPSGNENAALRTDRPARNDELSNQVWATPGRKLVSSKSLPVGSRRSQAAAKSVKSQSWAVSSRRV